MSPFFYIVAAFVIVVILMVTWYSRRGRPSDGGFTFVYVNQDGSARELTESERAYLNADFEGGDSGRPYVKSSYESKDGWGSISGFIERRKIPDGVIIEGVASADCLHEGESMEDTIADAEAVGDIVEYGEDGSIAITPNPNLNGKERFKLLTERQLQRQRDREVAAMNLLKKETVEKVCSSNAGNAPV